MMWPSWTGTGASSRIRRGRAASERLARDVPRARVLASATPSCRRARTASFATSGDEVLFVRDEEGGVVGYRSTADGEATLYRRVGKDAVAAVGEGTPEH